MRVFPLAYSVCCLALWWPRAMLLVLVTSVFVSLVVRTLGWKTVLDENGLVGALVAQQEVDAAAVGDHDDSRVRVGAQNMHWEKSGAFTGEVSPAGKYARARLVPMTLGEDGDSSFRKS